LILQTVVYEVIIVNETVAKDYMGTTRGYFEVALHLLKRNTIPNNVFLSGR